MAKLWQNKYSLDREIEKFTVGNDYLIDKALVKYDVLGSIAHAEMLCKIGILKKEEFRKLQKALLDILDLDKKGKFEIKLEDEDAHTAIENYLTEKLGDLGKKIHTARSRNDQVLTALRLYCKDEINEMLKSIDGFVSALRGFSGKYGSIGIPGYTHMRKAMPSSVSLWAGAFIESMDDNKKIMNGVLSIINQSPLGTGAGYGVPLKIDRKLVAAKLGFPKVQENPIYAQNSRGKFEGYIISSLSLVMHDLNKMASDLILVSMDEFGFFQLPKEFCTGSSIMPQKRNPDVLEIVRAKYHLVIGYEFQVKSLIGSLISGYNRDLQLTKEPVIKSFDITKECLKIMAMVVSSLKVDKEKCAKAMTREIYAVDRLYKLVAKGMPFRDAYRKISDEYSH